MKYSIFIATLLLSASAFASTLVRPIVEKVSQRSQIIAACPFCDGGTLETTTTFVVNFASCAEYSNDRFEILVEERMLLNEKLAKVISIDLKQGTIDCRAVARSRQYTLTTTELGDNEVYILDNPTTLNVK